LDNGFRNFAFAALTPETSAHELCEGFGQAVKTAGFACEVFTDQYAGWDERNWVKNLQRMDGWLLSLKKPVALLCIHDFKGQQACSACAHLGLRVPEDVAIVGCGNVELYCQISRPRLSSMEHDTHRIGYEAARLLHRMIQGARPPTNRTLIGPRSLVPRQSSDTIAMDDPDVAAALRFIRDHADQPIGVKDLRRQVPISRKTMERRFEKLVGHTPKAEITRVRIEQSKRLLTETDLAMEDVAVRSGFSNPSIFSFFFRTNTGLTPTQYRRGSAKLHLRPIDRG
jgi:LacI family transcriptional regulator